MRVLRPDGVLFVELIGDLHHQEMLEVFGSGRRRRQLTHSSDQMTSAMELAGVEVRLAADIVSKRYYPDVYEWLQFQCSIWSWSGWTLPSPDDLWVAGVKRPVE